MTDMTPGSRWLLPVTMEGDGAILIPGGYWHLLDDCYVPTLIPADRITELEAEVARLRDLVEEAYVEGWDDGHDTEHDFRDGYGYLMSRESWLTSCAIKELNPAPSEKEAG